MIERKAAGNTAHAKTVAKRKFVMLCDSWWDRRAQQLQCAADAGDIKKVHQLLREIYGPMQRKAICLPMPGWDRTAKTAKDTVEAFQVHFKAILNQDRMLTWILSGSTSIRNQHKVSLMSLSPEKKYARL